MKKSILLFIGTALLCTGFSLQAQQNIQIIVHKDVVITELDPNTIQKIFLGKKQFWDDGAKIIPVILKEGKVHEAFLRELIKRNDNQFRAFWNKAVFTGAGVPPKSFSDESEIIRFVAETPGAIGYIPAGRAADNVRTVPLK